MNSSVGMGSVFLVPGSATVRMNVGMPRMNAAACRLPLRRSRVSAPLALCRAPRPSPPDACPRACAATEPGTATMEVTNWVALTLLVANVWGTFMARLPLPIFSVRTVAATLSWDAPGCWTLRTLSPLFCSWTCSWGLEICCTSMTACCSERSICYRCCHITTTGGPPCWSRAGDRWAFCTWPSLTVRGMVSMLHIRYWGWLMFISFIVYSHLSFEIFSTSFFKSCLKLLICQMLQCFSFWICFNPNWLI